jgi:hypothetical protein
MRTYTDPVTGESFPVIDSRGDVDKCFANNNDGVSKGLEARDYAAQGVGSLPFSAPFDIPEIPRSEWADRIRESEKYQSRLLDVAIANSLPRMNQQQTNFCFPAGTLVRLKDGSTKPIDKMNVMDQVLTAEGNVGRVFQVIATPVKTLMFNMKLWGHAHLKATGGHPILTKRGYVTMAELQVGDMVAIPKYAPESVATICPSWYIKHRQRVKQTKKIYSSVVGRQPGVIVKQSLPDVVQLTPQLGRIMGLWLAEGHTSRHTVYWSFGKHEQHFVQEVVDGLLDSLGMEGVVTNRSNNVTQVAVHSIELARLMEAICGTGSGGKTMHADLLSGPKAFLEQVLGGWLDGDRQMGTSAVTVSRKLALDMYNIANALGLRPTFETHAKAGTRNDGITRRHAWKIAWGKRTNHGTCEDDRHMWRKVREVTSEEFEGVVYNLEVEGDHSYTAEGIGVHNCWINCVINAIHHTRALMGDRHVSLSPASAGGPIKGYRNQGGWPSDGIEYIATNGVCPVELWPANAIDKKYDNDESRDARKEFSCTEWYDLKPDNFGQLVTALLLGYPVANGRMWWSHATLSLQPVIISPTEFGIMDDNSWGPGFGNKGRFILSEKMGQIDGGVALRNSVTLR